MTHGTKKAKFINIHSYSVTGQCQEGINYSFVYIWGNRPEYVCYKNNKIVVWCKQT